MNINKELVRAVEIMDEVAKEVMNGVDIDVDALELKIDDAKTILSNVIDANEFVSLKAEQQGDIDGAFETIRELSNEYDELEDGQVIDYAESAVELMNNAMAN
jgi:predicted  nucleic acid-binding Zn-ribbon protein